MSAGFTPGPWEAVRAEDRNAFRVRTGHHYDGGLFICECHTALPDETAHAEANARLIAAAPELYRELANAVVLLRAAGVQETENGTIRAAEAALAKARGDA